MYIFWLIFFRDLKVAFKSKQELLTPYVFFLIVSSMIPLAIGPISWDTPIIGIGFIWIAILLSSLMVMDSLFRTDINDGSIDRFLILPYSFSFVVLAKIFAHWVVSCLSLIILAPIVAISFGLPSTKALFLVLIIFLTTPAISIFVAIGSALTASSHKGSVLIGLLVLPLVSPILIFATHASTLIINGESIIGPLYMLTAISIFAITFGPLICSASLKASLE